MASLTSTPRSRSRSSTTSSGSSDTTMLDAPAAPAPAQPRPASHSNPSSSAPASSKDPAFSLLLSLPRELRDRIYTYALVSALPFCWPAPGRSEHHVATSLLRASRQIYDEAAPILYAGNKFLFAHPSDCNIFRVISSPYSELISSVYFRVREKDLRLWTSYLGSKMAERSLKNDLPKLKNLWIFLRCASVAAPGMLGQAGGPAVAGLPPALAAQVHAAQNALAQQMGALQQQMLHQGISATGNAVPPPPHGLAQPAQYLPPAAPPPNDPNQIPPPPPPPMPFPLFQANHNHPPPANTNPVNPGPLVHHMAQHQHTFYASFLRWERETGIENLCLSLLETRPVDAEVKIICIMRLPKPEVIRLVRLYPEELAVDRSGDARTRFRRLHGVEVSLEISGYDVPT